MSDQCWNAQVMQWLMDVAALSPPEPEPGADVEAMAGIALIAHGWMICLSRCSATPAMRAQAAQQVEQGAAEIAEVERRGKALRGMWEH